MREALARIRKPIAGFIAQLVNGVDPDRLAAADAVLRAVIHGCLDDRG